MKRKHEEDNFHTVLKKFRHCRKRNMEYDLNEIFKKIKLDNSCKDSLDKPISYTQQRRDILVYI